MVCSRNGDTAAGVLQGQILAPFLLVDKFIVVKFMYLGILKVMLTYT